MIKRSWWMLILVAVAVLTVARWTNGAKPSPKETWEYKVVTFYGPSATTPAPDVAQLNDAGMQGWELIAIRSGNFPNADSKQVRTDYYFKR